MQTELQLDIPELRSQLKQAEEAYTTVNVLLSACKRKRRNNKVAEEYDEIRRVRKNLKRAIEKANAVIDKFTIPL